MTNSRYLTLPTVEYAQDGVFPEGFEWHRGLIQNLPLNIRADFGDRGANIRQNKELEPTRAEPIHQGSSVYFRATNDNDYEMNYWQDTSQTAIWPTMRVVKGFSIRWRQHSVASRAMWLKNVMVSMRNKDGDDLKWWASEDLTKETDPDADQNKFRRFAFSDADQRDMADYYFEAFGFCLGTEGGTTGRESEFTIGSFRLWYQAGAASSNNRWVAGKYVSRPYISTELLRDMPDSRP